MYLGETLLGEKPHTPKKLNVLFSKKHNYNTHVQKAFIGVSPNKDLEEF